MAAHRYWQAVGLQPYGTTGLDITEFQLLAGTTRVDASATLASNIAPDTGSLSYLQDGSATNSAMWSATNVKSLVLSWDFGGSPQDVTDIRLGGGALAQNFLLNVAIQFSDDNATWSSYYAFGGIAWPGARALTTSVGFGKMSVITGGTNTPLSTFADSTGLATVSGLPASTYGGIRSPNFKSAGIFQFELEVVSNSATPAAVAIGLMQDTASLLNTNPTGQFTGTWVYRGDGKAWNQNASTITYGATYTVGDVIGVVVNFTTGVLTFYKNGASQGASAASMTGLNVAPLLGCHAGVGTTVSARLRTRSFVYPIAGAAEWEPRDLVVTTSAGVVQAPVFVASAMAGIALPYGQIKIAAPQKGRNDYLTGVLGQGIGRLNGVVRDGSTGGTPIYRRVRLHRQSDGLLIREMWSDKVTGAYDFQYIDELQKYYVASFDHTLSVNAVIADNLTPDILPS